MDFSDGRNTTEGLAAGSGNQGLGASLDLGGGAADRCGNCERSLNVP